MTRSRRIGQAVILGALLVGSLLAGCGEKITVPVPKGLFSVTAYLEYARYPDDSPLQVAVAQGNLFVLTGDALTKRDQEYGLIERVEGLAGAAALCVDESRELVFVYERDASRVSWYSTTALDSLGHTALPDSHVAVAMATNIAGIDQEPGARTFLYLSNPELGVIHRYVFDDFNGLSPYGILARSNGDAARFVHVPAGLATDSEDSLLVCDADSARNWVIRFDAEPDLTDTTPAIFGQAPWRGRAALLRPATCVPPAAADYVIGDAAACEQSDWEGGVSDAEGALAVPQDVAVDGIGRIFVADTGNDRIQVFTPQGELELLFGNETQTPGPVSLDVVDVRYASGAGGVDYAAFVYVVIPGTGEVRKFISSEHLNTLNEEPPPPPN